MEKVHHVLAAFGQQELPPVLPGLLVGGVIVGDPFFGGDRYPGVQKALIDGDSLPLIHIAGAGAALDGAVGAAAVQSHLGAPFQRKEAVFVLQQDNAVCRRPPGHGPVIRLPAGNTGVGGAVCFDTQFHEDDPSLNGFEHNYDHYTIKRQKSQ